MRREAIGLILPDKVSAMMRKTGTAAFTMEIVKRQFFPCPDQE